MKTVTLYKVHNYDSLFGGYNWSITPAEDGNMVSSTPWAVEVPDDFSLAETVSGETMFFRAGQDLAYTLTIGRNTENGNPYLIGGNSCESIRLKVLGPIGKSNAE